MKDEEKAAEEYCNSRGLIEGDHAHTHAMYGFEAGLKYARENPGWISCAERLPEANQIVLIYMPAYAEIDEDGEPYYSGGPIHTVQYYGGSYSYAGGEYGYHQRDITHWMPLPNPPPPKSP